METGTFSLKVRYKNISIIFSKRRLLDLEKEWENLEGVIHLSDLIIVINPDIKIGLTLLDRYQDRFKILKGKVLTKILLGRIGSA